MNGMRIWRDALGLQKLKSCVNLAHGFLVGKRVLSMGPAQIPKAYDYIADILAKIATPKPMTT